MSNKIARRKLPLINEEGEVRELTREDMALFKPAAEVLPATLLKKLGIRRLKIGKLVKSNYPLKMRHIHEAFKVSSPFIFGG